MISWRMRDLFSYLRHGALICVCYVWVCFESTTTFTAEGIQTMPVQGTRTTIQHERKFFFHRLMFSWVNLIFCTNEPRSHWLHLLDSRSSSDVEDVTSSTNVIREMTRSISVKGKNNRLELGKKLRLIWCDYISMHELLQPFCGCQHFLKSFE